MKIINCTNQLDLGNDSGDSDDEVEMVGKAQYKQSEDGKRSDMNQDIIGQQIQ